MKSHPAARALYEIAGRSRTLEGCRVAAKLVCRRGHQLGLVHIIEGHPVAAMRQKYQIAPSDVPPAILKYEEKYGVRVFKRTEPRVLVDLLDETDPAAPRPILRGECACRPSPAPVSREWLYEKCQELDRNAVRQRRVVLG
jgi:hypothetical protein